MDPKRQPLRWLRKVLHDLRECGCRATHPPFSEGRRTGDRQDSAADLICLPRYCATFCEMRRFAVTGHGSCFQGGPESWKGSTSG